MLARLLSENVKKNKNTSEDDERALLNRILEEMMWYRYLKLEDGNNGLSNRP